MRRGLIAAALASAWLLALVATAFADGPETSCNMFEHVQSIVLAEGAYQPLDAKIEMARVAVTHGACEADGNFYAAFGLAQWVRETEPSHCMAMWVCRSFYMLYTIPPEVRESAAVAAHIALTEYPPVRRFHFDGMNAPRWAWWDSPRACPSGDFVSGEMRFC